MQKTAEKCSRRIQRRGLNRKKIIKRFLSMTGTVVLLGSLLTGCTEKSLYSKEELQEVHDVIGFVNQGQLEYQHVINGSLQPEKLSEKLITDMEFVDYLTTKEYDLKKPMIAFTFDDGPKTDTTNAILDILEENGAKATFFVQGVNIGAKTEPVLKRMVSLGCQIGNHSVSHEDLRTLDEEGIHKQIDPNNEKILEITGRPCRLIRPPYGGTDEHVTAAVEQPLIMWEIDTLDWKSRDSEKIIPIVREQITDGTIVLMHDLYPSTVEACRVLIPELVKKGYQFVTVSELAYMKGISLDAGSKYYDFRTDK